MYVYQLIPLAKRLTYLDYKLSYHVTVKDAFLTAVGYSRDSADQNSNAGGGYTKRKALFANSKTAQFMHKIDADLFNQDLYLRSSTILFQFFKLGIFKPVF